MKTVRYLKDFGINGIDIIPFFTDEFAVKEAGWNEGRRDFNCAAGLGALDEITKDKNCAALTPRRLIIFDETQRLLFAGRKY